jgi:hypothetical protein
MLKWLATKAAALTVLDRLVGELAHVLPLVPAGDRAGGGAAPAAEGLDRFRELEEMGAGASDVGQGRESGPAGRLVAQLGGHAQGEESGVVAGGAAGA